ncbi:MAG: hypothetical protein CVV24_06945 [Ignavibacteriae bacterium HGW-Ignavibacteriae-3]|nr:MAG: hypothetical protein CVV24_06945 [Ignavibacteriae bacterium HGW-Ignavibacteriae-3]
MGLIVLAGVYAYNAYTESSNRDQIISSMHDLGRMAQAHFKKNAALSGGGDYIGWNIPPELGSTDAGTFTARVRADRVNLICSGKYTGLNGFSPIRVRARIDNKGIKITVVN